MCFVIKYDFIVQRKKNSMTKYSLEFSNFYNVS